MLKFVSPSKTLSEFTKKYSLSKTLRFELKPVAETKNHLKRFIDLDTKRAKEYKELKKIIDEFHKDYIEAVLSAPNILNEKELKELHSLWKNNKQNSANKESAKKLNDFQKKLRNQAADSFQNLEPFLKGFFNNLDQKALKSLDKKLYGSFLKENEKEILDSADKKAFIRGFLKNPDKKKNLLFSDKFIKYLLPAWLENSALSEKEKKQNLVKNFSQFTTYLQGFYENRKNMYSSKEQGTAIAYRIVHENLPKFLDNLQAYQKIDSTHQELKKDFAQMKSELQKEFDYFQVENIDDLFQTKMFNKCLSQTGIDHYNTLLGGKTLETGKKIQGINEYINLYKQRKQQEHKDKDIKIKYSNKNLPEMEFLYKQILSYKKSHSFVVDEFHNKKELIHSIQGFSDFLFKKAENEESNLLEKIKELFTKDLSKEELSGIYIKQSEISRMSQHLFGDWNIISSALRESSETTKSAEKTKSSKKKESKKDFYSFEEIDKSLRAYLPEHDNWHSQAKSSDIPKENLPALYFRYLFYQGTDNVEKLFWSLPDNTDKNQLLQSIKESFSEFKKQALTDSTAEFKKEEGKAIQSYLSLLMDLFHLINKVYLEKDKKKAADLEKNKAFYNKLESYRENLFPIIAIYNKSRNFITSIDKSKKKIKINFEDSTLLDGWDINKETDNLAVLFKKKEDNFWKYYLGVMNKESSQQANCLFDYHIKETDESDKKKTKKELQSKILHTSNDENFYEKMNYKLLPDPSRMLPKVFFSQKHLSYFNPSPEIIKIREDKTYNKNDGKDFSKKDCHKLIDFYKESLKNHKEWSHFFNFKFSPTSEYNDISDFFSEVKNQNYQLSFDNIKSSYIEEKVNSGELLLFEIYNKDLSTKSKNRAVSKDNLHTLYFKGLFKENLVLKLDGQAEIFYRKAVSHKKIVHYKNQPIKNKNPGNPKKTSVFKYDLIKDKRFYEDKFSLHFPISLNFTAKTTKAGSFNQEVLKTLKNNKDINVIGIDRGERHLAYYTVINQNKKILEQGSFNKITYSYKNDKGETVKVEKDYHKLLDNKEKERDKNRKEWEKIHNIKELKAGYLSYLVHKISTLMIKYNAIVVFENLNFGFKKGRFKFEKQVYQKLEKALIDKLNYLVFKDKPAKEAGGYLNAYQLTAPFDSFKEMGTQTGFLFYTPAYYTSKICPLTGFANLIYPKYENIKKAQEFFKKFDKIYFDQQKDFFVFEYQDSKFCNKDKISFKPWKVCTLQEERYKWDFKKREFKKINITQELKKLFKEYKINYNQDKNLKPVIKDKSEKDFFYRLIDYLRVTLQLRYINPNAEDEKEQDFILSPVADASGRFFDSRKATEQEPKNADANGAYHIALKGLWSLNNIESKDDDKFKFKAIKNKEWFQFLQDKKLNKAS